MIEKMKHLSIGLAILSVAVLVLVTGSAQRYSVEVLYQYPQSETKEISEKPEEENSPIVSQEQEENVTNFSEEVVVQFPLELNQADYEELLLVPEIGPVTAERILQFRDKLGGFTSLQQLLEVKGIGPATFQKISPYFYLSGDEWDKAYHSS